MKGQGWHLTYKKPTLTSMARDKNLWGPKWSQLSATQKVIRVILYAVILYMAFSLFVGLFIPA